MPKIGDNEVLVRMKATSINPIEHKVRSGAAKAFYPLQFPAILGAIWPVKWLSGAGM